MINFKLKKHQKEALVKSLNKDSFAFFMDMGTGKTLTVLNWIKYKCLNKVLVVLRKDDFLTWRDQNNDFMGFSICEVVGSRIEKKEILKNHNSRLLLISYDSLKALIPILRKISFDAIVCDESTKIKNYSMRTKAVFKLAKYIKHKAVLTGTPSTNSIEDLVYQIKLLDGGSRLGTNKYNFHKKFCRKMYPFGYEFIPSNMKRINRKLDSVSYTISSDACLDLPDSLYIIKEAEETLDQKRYTRQIIDDWEINIDSTSEMVEYAISKLIKLQQISSGFLKINNSIFKFASGKIDTLLSLIIDSLKEKDKIVIWCNFNYEIELIKNAIEQKELGQCVTYNGKTKDKESVRKEFKNNKFVRFFIGQVRCGVGMNELVVSDTAIYFSNSYSLEARLQSEKRIRRIGSENHSKILYIDIVTKNSPVDVEILECLKNNKEILNEIMNFKIFKKDG